MSLSSLTVAITAAGFNSSSKKIDKVGLHNVINEVAYGIYAGGGTRIVQLTGGNQVYQFTNDSEEIQTEFEAIKGAYVTVSISDLAFNGDKSKAVLLGPSVLTCYCPVSATVKYYQMATASLVNSKIDTIAKSGCQLGCRMILEDHVIFISDSGSGTALTYTITVEPIAVLLVGSNRGSI